VTVMALVTGDSDGHRDDSGDSVTCDSDGHDDSGGSDDPGDW
jgi:hypothetical protein